MASDRKTVSRAGSNTPSPRKKQRISPERAGESSGPEKAECSSDEESPETPSTRRVTRYSGLSNLARVDSFTLDRSPPTSPSKSHRLSMSPTKSSPLKKTAWPPTPVSLASPSASATHTVRAASRCPSSDGMLHAITLRVGDVVMIDGDVDIVTSTDWLVPGVRSNAARQREMQVEQTSEERRLLRESEKSWKATQADFDDGLEDDVKIAVIADLYKDEQDEMCITAHWLARPKHVWANWGGREAFQEFCRAEAIHNTPFTTAKGELYYVWDAKYQEVHAKLATLGRSRKLAALQSAEYERLSKHAASMLPQAEDKVHVSHIMGHVKVVSHEEYLKSHSSVTQTRRQRMMDEDERDDTTPVFWVGRLFTPTLTHNMTRWFDKWSWDEITMYQRQNKTWHINFVDVRKDNGSKTSKHKQSKIAKTVSKRLVAPTVEDELLAFDGQEESSSDEDDDADAFSDHVTTDNESESDASADEADEASDDELETPAQKRANARADQRAAKHKAAIMARAKQLRQKRQAARAIGAQLPAMPQTAQANLSLFEQARQALHVGATPDYLPGREAEFDEIEAHLEYAIEQGNGTCLYIAGVPGTGKTATVQSVIKELQSQAETSDGRAFRYLEINGMKLSNPEQTFVKLWHFVSGGQKASPKQALASLDQYFKHPKPGRKTCVVLIDELDQLLTKKNQVVYNLFNWPHQPHSGLIVVAIANTMDLPERALQGKILSRLGGNRITYRPYTSAQLEKIIQSRLENLAVFQKAAVSFVSKRVSTVSGDARRSLDICRRTVERVEQANLIRLAKGEKERLIDPSDILATINEVNNGGPATFIKNACYHQKLMLVGLALCMRKAILEDSKAADVPLDTLLRWQTKYCRDFGDLTQPTKGELFACLESLQAAQLVLAETSRHDIMLRVRPKVSEADVKASLEDDAELNLGRLVTSKLI